MIVDQLSRAALYRPVHARLGIGLEAILSRDFAGLDDGRHDIAGDDVFALVQSYETRPPAQCRWEAHRRHIDIQLVLAGVEMMGHSPIEAMTETQPFDEEKDVAFFEGPGDRVTVSAGTFTIFFPHDVHMPCISPGASAGRVKKVVLKVRV